MFTRVITQTGAISAGVYWRTHKDARKNLPLVDTGKENAIRWRNIADSLNDNLLMSVLLAGTFIPAALVSKVWPQIAKRVLSEKILQNQVAQNVIADMVGTTALVTAATMGSAGQDHYKPNFYAKAER
ncbi:MAG: hypothetical protein V4623_09395 [Pseudomonadota bacterium]